MLPSNQVSRPHPRFAFNRLNEGQQKWITEFWKDIPFFSWFAR